MLLFLCRCLCHFRQFLRPVIATPQPLSSSPNPCRLCCCLWSFGHAIYSSFYADASIVVVDSAGQSVQDYLPLGCWFLISSGGGLHLWLLGALVYLTLFGIYIIENIWGVNCIPREFTRNIQSFCLSSICVVCDIDKTGKRALKLSIQWKTNYLWVVEFVFFLTTVFTCDCWAR